MRQKENQNVVSSVNEALKKHIIFKKLKKYVVLPRIGDSSDQSLLRPNHNVPKLA